MGTTASCTSVGAKQDATAQVPSCATGVRNGSADVPADFAEIISTLESFRMDIPGGVAYPTGMNHLSGKQTRNQLAECTDYEHICLSILGLAKLQQILPELVQLNNGKFYMENPGTQLMERECGFTMHADRAGTASTMRDAPGLLLSAFNLAVQQGQAREFFAKCFDRRHDPCLEGRVGL